MAPAHAFVEPDVVVAVGYTEGGCSDSDSADCSMGGTEPKIGFGLGLGGATSANSTRVGIVLRGRFEIDATTKHVDENRGWFFLLGVGPYFVIGERGKAEAIAGVGLASPGGPAYGGLGLGVRYTHHIAPLVGLAAQASTIALPIGLVAAEGSLAVVLQLEDH